MRTSQTRQAFTLVELLVVIAIIGVLVALLLPAVQAAREAARRMQCGNNLKQLALAMHNYHDTHSVLPASSYCANTTASGTTDYARGHSWIETLFPFIEQQNLYNQIDFKISNQQGTNPDVLNAIKLNNLMCPTDPDKGMFPNAREKSYTPYVAANAASLSLGANYVLNAGPMHTNLCPIAAMTPNINCKGTRMGRWDDESYGMFNGGRTSNSMSVCLDGTSNTFLLGEALPIYNTLHMYFVSHAQCGTTNPPPNYHRQYTACPKSRDSRVDTCYAYMSGFKSEHTGGVQMAMVDGSVQFVNETINYTTWVYLGDRADRQPASVR